MTSDLLIQYRRHLEQGKSHTGALKALSEHYGFDFPTARRVIERAEREDKPRNRSKPAA